MYCAYIVKNDELDLGIPTLELYYAMPALVAMYNGRLEIEGKPHINSVNELAIFPTTIEIMTHPCGLLVVLWSHNGAGEEAVSALYEGCPHPEKGGEYWSFAYDSGYTCMICGCDSMRPGRNPLV